MRTAAAAASPPDAPPASAGLPAHSGAGLRRSLRRSLSPPGLPHDDEPSGSTAPLDMLLSNAFKFTPEGGRAWVRLRPLAHAVEIEVSDTGPGIPPTDQERIFERFFRREGITDQAVPGTGIGLTIARGIAVAHGGWLTCTSVVGTGSTFTMTLPDGADA